MMLNKVQRECFLRGGSVREQRLVVCPNFAQPTFDQATGFARDA